MDKKIISLILILCLAFSVLFTSCTDDNITDFTETTQITCQEQTTQPESALYSESATEEQQTTKPTTKPTSSQQGSGSYKAALESIPEFSGTAYVSVNNNNPGLSASDRTSRYFESYQSLDSLGRCGVAFACLGRETMPTEERGAIGSVKPSGWHTVKYDIVDGKYLYNRCHLIGFQLSGENANTRNLITGTRYLNVEGMLPFENMVADYIKETGNHVLYRVTPIFKGNELVCRGVQIEAYSVEDNGDGICFNVYCYNNQPGISINYATGESELNKVADTTKAPSTTKKETSEEKTTSGNAFNASRGVWVTKSGKRYHSDRYCSNMKEPSNITIEEAKSRGYTPCSKCY